MDKQELHDLATYHVRGWWKTFLTRYPNLGSTPRVVINARLKTTAGRAFYLEGYIDLSLQLFQQYPERFVVDTIPHELAHMVAWRVYNDPGHGKGWKLIVQEFNIQTTRLHNMVNQQWKR